MEKRLYQWQEECLKRWFANNGRGMVQAVTGSGKTLLALTAAKQLEQRLKQERKQEQNRELRIKIVVPTSALMRQWERALKEFLAASGGEESAFRSFRGEIGLRGGGCKASPNCKYMIYVINSARYELARQILSELRSGEAVLLIADECHHYSSGQNQLIFEFLPYMKAHSERFFSLGLSATLPAGQARSYLASVLGQKIYSYGMAKASASQTVCQYDIYHIELSFQSEEREEYEELSERMLFLYRKLIKTCPFLSNRSQKELFDELRRLAGGQNRKTAKMAASYMTLSYKRKSLVCLASARIACACDLIGRLNRKEKILVFGERISQAEELYGLLQEQYPQKVGRYHSKMGQQANKNVLERFRVGDIRILVACKSLDEGVDIPDVSIGIILSGTSTQRQRIQRLGRLIRQKEGKSRAALYYLHIAETSEDVCYLPDAGERHIFELEYFPDLRQFSNPLYDEAAAKVLEQMHGLGLDERTIREAERCLELGCVRSDWRLEHREIEEQIGRARYVSDKNYWICMKKLGCW